MRSVGELGPEPNPYRALERVLGLRASQQRKLLRLSVWCETGSCSPVRVFRLREGHLVQCRSDANAVDLQDVYPHLGDWSRRRAFFLDWWLVAENEGSMLQVVCECDQTHPRLVDPARVAAEMPDEGARARNVSLPDVAAERE